MNYSISTFIKLCNTVLLYRKFEVRFDRKHGCTELKLLRTNFPLTNLQFIFYKFTISNTVLFFKRLRLCKVIPGICLMPSSWISFPLSKIPQFHEVWRSLTKFEEPFSSFWRKWTKKRMESSSSKNKLRFMIKLWKLIMDCPSATMLRRFT